MACKSWSRHVLIQYRAEDKLLFCLKCLVSFRDVSGHYKKKADSSCSVLSHECSEALGKKDFPFQKREAFVQKGSLFVSVLFCEPGI